MSQIISNLKLRLDEDLQEKLEFLCPDFGSYRILRKSVDARRKGPLRLIYTIELFDSDENPTKRTEPLSRISTKSKSKPIVIGTGPAGLFAALRLAERGVPCLILERGSECAQRMLKINRYWRYGELNKDDNVCFGEGGAGLYSDGKLITRIKSPFIPYVLEKLVEFGAPEEILYLSNPHVGSDKIRRIIPKIRQRLLELGCTLLFNTKVEKLLTQPGRIYGVQTSNGEVFHSDHVVLATGHSASDMFTHLYEEGISMEGKSFAVGLRVEHPQAQINKIQFRENADHPKLGAANYKLTHHNKESGIGVYSFCMCPGGYVLSSGTEDDGVVTNGMSNFNRNSLFANAALVVTIDHEKLFGKDIFGGIKFRRQLEKNSFLAIKRQGGTKEIPVQTVTDFLDEKLGQAVKSSSPSGVLPVDWNKILPRSIVENLKIGLDSFNTKMRGFISENSQLHGIESRTSCPIRVLRDKETYQSISHKGLYPTGEGAGYAGGITSAAVDGIRVAEAIAIELDSKYSEQEISL